MADYRRSKFERRMKAYRDKKKNDAFKNIEEPLLDQKDPEDVKRLMDLWHLSLGILNQIIL